MQLKEANLYDAGDHLGITSKEPSMGTISERIYLSEAEWDVLLIIKQEFVQDSIMDILEEERDMKFSTAYIEYKKNLESTLSQDLQGDVEGAKQIKERYLDSKTVTYRTRAILEILDEIIYEK